jgi:serine/threonine protein kinase/Flp pilus assembly protein TadD
MHGMIGQITSHYKILEKIGGGGMGVVYKAQDLKLDRAVALKFLPPELTLDPDAKERFVHEAKAASSLQHHNICTIHDIDQTADGQMFIVMDLYEGETLKSRIAKSKLRIEEALDIAGQVAQGLARAHEAGIIHRDIKPANIIITRRDEAKIVDFGLAKLSGRTLLTKSGTTLGTAAYMSPEQAKGEQVDQRTDIWSLGVVLYEMLTGKRPFESEYEQAMMYAIISGEPRPIEELRPEVPGNIIGIVQRAMEKDKEKRFQTATAMVEALRGEGKPQKKRVSKRKKRMLYGFATVLVLVAAGIVLFFSHGKGEVYDSIAVLPAENLSGDENQEPFTDGMTTAVIGELEKVRSLTPIAWQSVKRYRNTDKSIADIARELGVKAIVSMQCLREKDNVEIKVSLIAASSQKSIWSNKFDRELTSVLVLQSEVAQAIVREIRVAVTQEEQRRLVTSGQVKPEVYEMYLKGRHHWNKRTSEDLRKAAEYFNQAIENDSGYALAYAGLAQTYVVFPEYVGLPGKEYLPRSEAAARRALELDENLAEAYSVLGLIHTQYAYDWAGGERELKKAMELNPNYPTAHHWYGLMLRSMGRLEEAMTETKRAQELDPLSLAIRTSTGVVLHSMRRYDEAIEQYKKTLELDQNFPTAHSLLGDTYCQKGMFAEAIAEYQKVRSLAGSSRYRLGNLGYTYARSGNTGEAKRILDELLAVSRQGYVVSYGIALVYNGLGLTNEALRWLEIAYEERDRWIPDVMIDRTWDNLRTDVRFKALLQKMGLER